MALVTTIFTVVAILGGISLLLWFCTAMENRHLGPRTAVGAGERPAPPQETGPAPALTVVEAVQPAA